MSKTDIDNSNRQKPPEFPDKFSDFIRLATSEGRKLDRERYKPSDGDWHRGSDPDWEEPEGICLVCFAGVVMAGFLGCGFRDYASPGFYYGPEYGCMGEQLCSLEFLRAGWLGKALAAFYNDNELLKVRLPIKVEERMFDDWPSFLEFCDDMDCVANELEASGY